MVSLLLVFQVSSDVKYPSMKCAIESAVACSMIMKLLTNEYRDMACVVGAGRM